MMKERLRTLLKEMAALDAVAGFEQPMVAYLKKALAGLESIAQPWALRQAVVLATCECISVMPSVRPWLACKR